MRTFWIFLSANAVLTLQAVFFYPYQIQSPPSKALDGSGHEGHSETSSKMWCLLTYMSHRHHETLKWQNCKYKVKMEISSGIAWQTGTYSQRKSRGLQVSMASTATWKSYFRGSSLAQYWQQRKMSACQKVLTNQFARKTRETKQPQGVEAEAHLSSTPQENHEKFSNWIQGHMWCVRCLLCLQIPLVPEAAAEAEQSCNRCGSDDAEPLLPFTAEDGQHSA